MVTYAVDAAKRFQFEDNSGSYLYSQKDNCGPACATMIAGYYRERWYGIEATRKLVTSPGGPTKYTEQRDMLIARGVPATLTTIDSVAQLHAIVGSGRRPIILAVNMSLIPYQYRDHSFTGMHAVACLDDYAGGVLINDPNFSPLNGYRPDPDGGLKRWPDWLIQDALIDPLAPAYAIVPNASKPLPAPPPPPPTPAPVEPAVIVKPKAEKWRIRDGAYGYRSSSMTGTRTRFGEGKAISMAESADGALRLLNNGYWVARADLTPLTPGGDPVYQARVTSAYNS